MSKTIGLSGKSTDLQIPDIAIALQE